MRPGVCQAIQTSRLANQSSGQLAPGPAQTHLHHSGWLRGSASKPAYIITILGLGYSDTAQGPLELEDFARSPPNPSGNKAAPSRAARRGDKKLRKLKWLAKQEEMKFSHSIQFNAVPDWSSNYISYSNLKKL